MQLHYHGHHRWITFTVMLMASIIITITALSIAHSPLPALTYPFGR